MKFLTGKDYPNLCEGCQAIVNMAAEVLGEGIDTDDDEAPCNWVYDQRLFCGGHVCLQSEERKGKEWRVHAYEDTGAGYAFLWEEKFDLLSEAQSRAQEAAEKKAQEIGGRALPFEEGMGWGAYAPDPSTMVFFEVNR